MTPGPWPCSPGRLVPPLPPLSILVPCPLFLLSASRLALSGLILIHSLLTPLSGALSPCGG